MLEWLCKQENQEVEADIHITDSAGEPPLFAAIWQGHTETVRWLVDHGAGRTVGLRNARKQNSVWAASWRGRTDVLRFLDARGLIDEDLELIHTPDARGFTPLWVACGHQFLDVLAWLDTKEGGCRDLDVPDNMGVTPFQHALGMDCIGSCMWLVGHGCDLPTAQDVVQKQFHSLNFVARNLVALCKRLRHDLALRGTFRRVALFGMHDCSGSPHLSKLCALVGLRQHVAAYVFGATTAAEARRFQEALPKLRELLTGIRNGTDDHQSPGGGATSEGESGTQLAELWEDEWW